MNNIQIRVARIEDAELIADLSRQTFIETFAARNTKENMDKFLKESFSEEILINEVGAPNNIFLLASEDEQPVGYVMLKEDNNPPELSGIKSIEVSRIYITQSYLGKGIGKLMMKECINIAIERKKDFIWLGVWEHNIRAIDFYLKWGFQKFSTHIFKLGDDNQTDWLMKKSLIEVTID